MRLRLIGYWFIGLLGLLINGAHFLLDHVFLHQSLAEFLSEDTVVELGLFALLIPLFGVVSYLLLRYDRLLTERQQAQQALRESTERLRTLVDRAADAIFVINMEGRILEVNNQACESLGYTRAELLELNIADVDEEVVTHEHRRRFWEKLTSEQATVTLEGTQRRKDGTTFPVEVRVALLKSGAQRSIIGLARDITERKRAEEALRERNKELNCLYEISRVVESSSESSVEEMLQRIVNILPGSWQYPEIAGAQITMDGNEWTTANWQQTQWRQSADIHVHGELSGAVQVCYLEERGELDEGPFLKEERDLIDVVAERLSRITERKQAEEALNHFKSALESSSDAVGMSTPEGKHWYQNKALDDLFGDIGSDPPATVYVDEKVGREVFETIMAGDEWTGEVEMRGKDGETLDILLRAYAIKDEDGKVTGIVGVHTDITEQKRAEVALQEAYQRNETILGTSMDGFFTMRPDGTIGDCNEAFCEMSGYSRDELLAMRITDLEAVEAPEETAQHIKEVMEAGGTRFETAHRRKDGTLIDLEISTTFVELPDESFSVCFARDITETKKLWQELNQQLLRDSLTGVYNRRYFNETIIQEIKRADRYKHHISFIMGDVDGLKAINDNFGHLMGDQILQGVAQVLKASVRAADMVVRYGGDEFLVVMPETPEEQAQQAVSRIQQDLTDWLDEQVEIGVLHSDILAQVGFSLGIASCQPGDEIAIEEVLTQADEAMYQVKQTKRRAPVAG